MQLDAVGKAVQLDVAPEPLGRLRNRLDRDHLRTRNLGGQDRVAAGVGADVTEQVTGAQGVHHERHVGEFVQADIDVAGNTRLGPSGPEPGVADERNRTRAPRRGQLPDQRVERTAPRPAAPDRMAENEAREVHEAGDHLFTIATARRVTRVTGVPFSSPRPGRGRVRAAGGAAPAAGSPGARHPGSRAGPPPGRSRRAA